MVHDEGSCLRKCRGAWQRGQCSAFTASTRPHEWQRASPRAAQNPDQVVMAAPPPTFPKAPGGLSPRAPQLSKQSIQQTPKRKILE